MTITNKMTDEVIYQLIGRQTDHLTDQTYWSNGWSNDLSADWTRQATWLIMTAD